MKHLSPNQNFAVVFAAFVANVEDDGRVLDIAPALCLCNRDLVSFDINGRRVIVTATGAITARAAECHNGQWSFIKASS